MPFIRTYESYLKMHKPQPKWQSVQFKIYYHLLFFSVRRYEDPLNKYVYLTDLLCTNQRLFYKLLSENVEEMMPIVYTPTVGLACQKFGYIFTKPQVKIGTYLLIV